MENKKIEAVVSKCKKKWGIDSKTANLMNLVDNWFDNIDQNDREIYLRLLDNFNYYTKESEGKYAKFVVKKIKEIDPLISESIIVPLLKQEEGISGAYKLVRSIQIAGGLNTALCPTSLATFEEEFDLNYIRNIIIVDDIAGTGNTLVKNFNYMKNKYPNFFIDKNIYLTCLVTTKIAKSEIKKNLKNDYTRYWTYHFIKKSFDENNIFKGDRCIYAKEKVKKYELKLSNSGHSDIFGYKQSEILVAFSDNTPNNTLLSFWKEKDKWNPIFPRAKTTSCPAWVKNKKNAISLIKKSMNP